MAAPPPVRASMIDQRVSRAAVAGTNTPIRPTLSPAAGIQLKASSSHAPGSAGSHPARASGGSHGAAAIHASAARGIATSRSALPYAGRIQRSFGRHDISSIQAHLGSAAAAAAIEIGADAYTTGHHVVLGKGTDLFTVAHEAAHVIQQRAGVRLDGGLGVTGDRHEQHADAVAARVSAGQSAEALLDRYTGRNAAAPGVPHTTRPVDVGAAADIGPSPGAVESTSATGATGPIQCSKTKIVDDPKDIRNTSQPGQWFGLLKDAAGTIRDASDYEFGPLHNDCGTFMHAWIDPRDSDVVGQGTEPKQGTWPSWWAAVAPNPNNYWVRGHLLNHNLGGPGEKRNLTPITKQANKAHHDNVEQVLKHAVSVGAAFVDYEVEAKYDSVGPPLAVEPKNPPSSVWPLLTTHFECKFTIVDQANNTEEESWIVENEH